MKFIGIYQSQTRTHLKDAFIPLNPGFPFSALQTSLKSDDACFHRISLQFRILVPPDYPVQNLKPFEPLIRDRLFTFLQAQTFSQIKNQGIDSLRDEILYRVATILDPIPISKILFQELLIQ